MILILSNEDEQNVFDVIDWIDYYNAKYTNIRASELKKEKNSY